MIGGVSVYPVLWLRSLLQRGFLWQLWSKPAQIKGHTVQETDEFLSPWELKQPSPQDSIGKHGGPCRALSQQASFLCWMPAAAFPITGKPISSQLWTQCSTLLSDTHNYKMQQSDVTWQYRWWWKGTQILYLSKSTNSTTRKDYSIICNGSIVQNPM